VRGSILSLLISLPAVLLLSVLQINAAESREDISALVKLAAQPEIMFENPTRFDSLMWRITSGDEQAVGELLGLADTPWAWQFEVVRRALERRRETARKILLERLDGGTLPDDETSRYLVLFEKLGRAGDESFLAVNLRAESRTVTVPALRCLAAFGSPQKSLNLLAPLCASGDPHIRLGAAWAAGELLRRAEEKWLPDKLEQHLKALLSDSIPQVRITAAETLGTAGRVAGPGLIEREER
jgi:hypothetical protein